MRLGRVVIHCVLEQLIRDGGQRHRRAGVTTVGGLNGIHAEAADGVDGEGLIVSGGGSHRHAREGWRSGISDPESVPARLQTRKP